LTVAVSLVTRTASIAGRSCYGAFGRDVHDVLVSRPARVARQMNRSVLVALVGVGLAASVCADRCACAVDWRHGGGEVVRPEEGLSITLADRAPSRTTCSVAPSESSISRRQHIEGVSEIRQSNIRGLASGVRSRSSGGAGWRIPRSPS
jgi:hypothetical protein